MDAYLNSNFSLHDLLEKQIPAELAKLEGSSHNLERVAAYTENNYQNKHNKKQAFEDTKQMTTQSLASVAYQINQLSSMLIRCLDLECENIGSKANEVNNISQEISISNERNARQQIGAFTHSKNVLRNSKIMYPPRRAKAPRHQFTEIDFNSLDSVGHAPKAKEVSHGYAVNRTNSILSGSDDMSTYSTQPPYDFLIPRGSNATLTRKSVKSDYRVPQMNNYADIQRYSTVTSRNGMLSDNGHTWASQNPSMASRATILPPHQPLGSISQYRLSMESNEGLPPPPSVLTNPIDEPLPPPPFDEYTLYEEGSASTPDWVPSRYIEKALAIYDYEAEKEDELNLRENCVVYVVAKNDDGWYEGVMDGMTGLFPSNYVQTI